MPHDLTKTIKTTTITPDRLKPSRANHIRFAFERSSSRLTGSTHLHEGPWNGDVIDAGSVAVHRMRVRRTLRWKKVVTRDSKIQEQRDVP